ncbi:hypothetical protein [Aquirufa echingensis]|uniref:Uncharacterized protein n=1 Tax=Aquirufa echingensis TaxID=3096516 RepID=A0ABW6CW37_9BACT
MRAIIKHAFEFVRIYNTSGKVLKINVLCWFSACLAKCDFNHKLT